MRDEIRDTSEEKERERAELVKKSQLAVYWGEYSCLQETLRRIEKRVSKAWGAQVVTPPMTTARVMKQLRQELEALEVGFSSDE